MKKVFISYRRDTAEDFARSIARELSDRGCEVFFDHDSLQKKSGEFWKILRDEIERCDYFLLIISESTFDKRIFEDNVDGMIKDYVKFEISQALKFGKEIIPIIVHNCKFPTDIPPEIERVQNFTAIEVKQAYYAQSLNLLYKRLNLSRFKYRKNFLITLFLLLLISLVIVCTLHDVYFDKPRYSIDSLYISSETQKQYYDETFVFAGRSQAPLINIYITTDNMGVSLRKLIATTETVDGQFRHETSGELWWHGVVLFEIVPCDYSGQELTEHIATKEMTINRKGSLDVLEIVNDSYITKRGETLKIIWTETYYPENITYILEIISEELYVSGQWHINDAVLYRADIKAGEYMLSEADTSRIPVGEYVIMVSSELDGYSGCEDIAYLTVEE